jgi:hypothetical protein
MKRRIPTKQELLQLQKLYKTDKRIGQALGSVPENLVAYWRRKKGIGRSIFPKYSLLEIKELWERFGDDAKAGAEMGVTKQAFYRWRKKYKLLEKPAILKLEQLEFKFFDEQRLTRAGNRDLPALTAIQRIIAAHCDGKPPLVGAKVLLRPDLVLTCSDGGWQVNTNGKSTQRFRELESLFASGFFRPGQVCAGDNIAAAALAITGSLVFVSNSPGQTANATADAIEFEVTPVVKVTIGGQSQSLGSPFTTALYVMRELESIAAGHFALELCGLGVDRLLVADRMALLVYARLFTGRHILLTPDQIYLNLLSRYNQSEMPVPFSDRDVYYLEEVTATVGRHRPVLFSLQRSRFVDDLAEFDGRRLARVRVGPLLGGSIEDLKLIATALHERSLDEGPQLYIIPRSRQVFLEALKRRYVQKIVEAGGHVADPAALPAFPPLASDQVELTTEVDCGSPGSYLATAATILPIVIAGKISRRHVEIL